MIHINGARCMARQFQAVIFDFGGVFTTSPFEAFNRLEAERGLPRDFIRSVNATNADNNAWARLERSEIGPEAFSALFARESAALGHVLAGEEVLGVLGGDVRPEMVAALDRIRAHGLRVGCITNNMKGRRADPEGPAAASLARYQEVFARFEHVLESAVAGVRKPDPRIYLMMCDLLAVGPQACVFLDDIGVNCKGAASVGMQAIKVTDPASALAQLGALLDIELRA